MDSEQYIKQLEIERYELILALMSATAQFRMLGCDATADMHQALISRLMNLSLSRTRSSLAALL